MKRVLRRRFATAVILLLIIVTLLPLVTLSSGSPGSSIMIVGQLSYVNELSGLSPMRRVKVYLMDNDTWEGFPQDEEVAWQYTDDAGNFAFTVDNNDGLGQGGRDPYVVVESSNPAAVAMSPFSVIHTIKLPQAGTNVPDGFFHNYGALYPLLKNEAWQAIDAVLSVRDWIWDKVAWQRPPVTIYWPAIALWPACEGDKIYLPDKIYWDWDHVEVYHQYALSVLYNLYGGMFPVGWLGPIPPHSVFFESSTIYAFVAGWAEFIQCAVDNDPSNLEDWDGGHGGNIETNDWFNSVDVGDMDGEIVEGSVASVLWDIFDPVNDDPLDLGFDEIFYLMQDYKMADFSTFWNWWVLRYPALQGDLSTICWMYGIDKDFYPPTGTLLINGGALYTTSTYVTLTVSASDYGSGVAYMRFSNFPDAWFWGLWFPDFVWSKWYPYDTSASWTLWPGDGTKSVFAQFMDKKGLVTSGPSLPADSIILDTVPPTGTIVINGGAMYTTSTSVTLTLAYSDFTSGVWQVRYSNDGSTWTLWEPPSTTRAWVLTPGDGTKTVYYQIQDHAGLISLTYIDTIILDTTPPTGSIVIKGGDAYTQWPFVMLSLTYSDATSGVQRVRYSNDGFFDTEPWESPMPFRLWVLTPGDGPKFVYYQVQDYAGLTSTFTDGIILDSTPPTTTYSHANPSSVVYLFASDALSGPAATYYRINYGPWYLYGGSITLPSPAPYTHVISYYSIDNAGNIENTNTLLVHYLTIETNVPEVTPVNHPWQEGWYTDGVTAYTPTAPDKYWMGSTLFGFQTWEKDTVAVPGNPVSVVMSGPHWLRAGYLGAEVILVSKVGDKLNLKLRLRSEVTTNLHLKIRITGPGGIDETFEGGIIPVTGGIDITTPLDPLTLPGGLSGGTYYVYFKFYDPTSGDERAESRISFTV